MSGLFLFFVLVNGVFKYWINVAKGALGERMLRRMRFDLFALVLRFTPDALRNVKSSETATIIKDEVEPIGGFIGDAFILPVFLGTQAATALIFIMVQNFWLGLMAAGVVSVQFTIIPRLRRELLRLGKQRQLASRRLAGRVGEVVDGIEAVHVHDADNWERAEIGHRLCELFDLRFRIYKRKFMVKFLNNLLAQMTPFFFYSIGGYLALTRPPRHRPARRRHRRLSGAAAAAEGADRLGPAAPRRPGQVRSGRPALRAGAAAAGSRGGRSGRRRRAARRPARGQGARASWTRMAEP